MKQINQAIEKILDELLENGKIGALSEVLITMNPADAGIYLNNIPEDALDQVFTKISSTNAGLLFVELDFPKQENLVTFMDDDQLREMLDYMFIDDVSALVRDLPEAKAERVRNLLDPDTASQLDMVMSFPEESIGNIMNTEFLSLKPTMTIADAIASIRSSSGMEKETVNICYVTDRFGRLAGSIPLRTLVTARDEKIKISQLMDSRPVAVNVTDDQEAVSHVFRKYDLTVIPVVDKQYRLVGITTVDDAIDVIETEATEDMQKMAAIIPTETPYLKTPVFRIWLNRIPWLLVLMIGATFTAKVITSFENALSSCVILTAFIPMLMDTAGNAGSQSSVTIVRGLALGELTLRDWYKVMWKEVRVALMCGVVLIVCNFAKLMLLDRVTSTVAMTVCFALFLAVVISKMIGSFLPILIGSIGLDPAVMAGPILTTIVDALTLLIYFTVATHLLGL